MEELKIKKRVREGYARIARKKVLVVSQRFAATEQK